MDLLATCKEKLAHFRIKELKDILTHLGLSKQGKKQDLVDRILNILSDEQGVRTHKKTVGREEVAKLVDETYRKMQGIGAGDLNSKSEVFPGCVNARIKEEIENSAPLEKIRCLCGSTLQNTPMIKCEDPTCNVLQHRACVLIPEKPLEGVLPKQPVTFYCELCRLARADPFLVTIANPLMPVKLNITNTPTDGTNPSQSIEKKFQLSRSDRDMLEKQDYDIQVWCMLLNDKVTFRMHWLQYPELQIKEFLVFHSTGVPVRAINRPGSQLLGANVRDDGHIITHYTRDGINRIFLGGCDARVFCLGVRIVKRRTLCQVLDMIPKESEGERFEDALNRVRRCVGGGTATENADSDSDIEVVADCIPVNLRCPMSGLRMKVAGRFKDCAHMGCFDLEVFVEMNQHCRKWQCPICLKNYSLEKIIIDPYFNRITSKMKACAEDVADIEVKRDGSWRAKTENGDRRSLGELGLWHSPDGSIVSTMAVDSKPQLEHKHIKEEVGADFHSGLRLGIKKNQNGIWEINKLDALQHVSQTLDEDFDHNVQNIITMSSSATGSGRECDDGSVNQGTGANLDTSIINGPAYGSFPMNIDTVAPGFGDQVLSASGMDADVIVLSDSEEDAVPIMPSGAAYRDNVSGVPFQGSLIPDPYYEDPTIGKGIDLYGENEDFGINMWLMPPGGQGGPGFQLFGPDIVVAGTLLDMQHGSINCAPPVNGFALPEELEMRSAAIVGDPAGKVDIHDSLVDYPLASYPSDDPSLQIFLPTAPSDALAPHSDPRYHPDTPNGIRNEDWISLRLGDIGMNQVGMRDSGLRQQEPPTSVPLDPMADTGSLLLDTCDGRSAKTSRERSDNFLSIPRQRRSVRPRLHLSIDPDSG